MTSRELNALFGLLALREGFLSKDQLLAGVGLASSDGDLPKLLVGQRILRENQARAIEGLMAALLETHGSAKRAIAFLKPPGPLKLKLLGSDEGASSLLRSRDTSVRRRPKKSPEPLGERFLLGAELGQGGLARVIEAEDREIGRKVALKIVFPDEPQEVLDRFRWEAQITGRLEHPNIVPVHEMGVLPSSGLPYFAMKKVVGKDLHDVIHGAGWPVRRLTEVLRDVCRAVAFAHARGVIHRDLKPANIMVGDFGEVLVVDWGLARLVGQEAAPGDRSVGALRGKRPKAGARAPSSHLTMEGDVLGTPSYMPPEQAMGKLDELDERTDVYSLGAILYEILTGRPPFDGKTSFDILNRVVSETAVPPSRVRECAPELEAICVRAIAKKREERFAGAAEMAAELDLYLEGTKERERREALAREHVGRARREIERWRRLSKEARAAALRAREMEEQARPKFGEAGKRRWWTAEDEADRLERESVEAFGEANAALANAMSNVPGHGEARRLKAELSWEKFLQCEEDEDRPGMQLYLSEARGFNDGALDGRLSGAGTLAVAARAWSCACLAQGRDVAPGELAVLGFHPWSARDLERPEVEGVRAYEPAGPARLRVHGERCRREMLEGADVWAFRYEESDRKLVPVTEKRSGPAVPDAVLDELFGDSPYRPRGGGFHLGRTPIAPRAWPMGSWLLVVARRGRVSARVPVEIGRQQQVAVDVTLYASEEVPPGFVPVNAGPFHWQGDRLSISSDAGRVRTLDDFLMQRHPVTCVEYRDFLNDLDPAQAAARVPRQSETAGPCWPLVDGRFVVPTAEWLATSPEASRARRLSDSPVDWREDWPVLAVSWEDALAYASWASRRTGFLLGLPHEALWEKSGRGADSRFFPWGKRFDFSNANLNESQLEGARPCPVHDFSGDESPFGVRGLAGNARDCCLNDAGGEQSRWRIVRGGSWPNARPTARLTYRAGGMPKNVTWGTGFRLACLARVPMIEGCG